MKEECDKLLSQQRHMQSKLHSLEEELGRIHSKVSATLHLDDSVDTRCMAQSSVAQKARLQPANQLRCQRMMYCRFHLQGPPD